MIEAPPRGHGAAARGVTLRASASLAIADVVMGPQRPWHVLGATTHTWWCAADDDVIVITDDRMARLPNAVIVFDPLDRGIDPVAAGVVTLIGDGAVGAGTGGAHIVRWWDPRVTPIPADAAAVARRVRPLVDAVASVPGGEAFCAALGDGDDAAAVARAGALIGRGVGLTPEGDDYLTGAIAGFRHVAGSIGRPAAVLEAVRDPLLRVAGTATTRLSRTLIRHAFAGDVAAPVGALLRSLTGRGHPSGALATTMAIGGSSGPALASGVVCGAAAACGVGL